MVERVFFFVFVYDASMKTSFALGALSLHVLVVSPAFADTADVSYRQEGNGSLLVTVESAPLMGSVPRGATRIPVAIINLSASCDADIRVDSIEVAHVGFGNASDISAVYLTDGTRRISRARGFDTRSRTADLRIPSLTVPKCDAVRLHALMDIATDAVAAGEHGLTVAHASVVQSTAADTTLSYAAESEVVVTRPEQAGSITVNFLPIRGPLRYGRIETLARLQLTADAKNDHLLSSILLTNLEDARDMDLTHMRLETRSGEFLSRTAFRMKGRTVRLEFDPTYILSRNKTVVILLKGTVNGSQRRKVQFHLEERSDIEASLYRPR